MCGIVLLLIAFVLAISAIIIDWFITKEVFSAKLKNLGQFLLGAAAIVGVAQIPRITVSQNVNNSFYQTTIKKDRKSVV